MTTILLKPDAGFLSPSDLSNVLKLANDEISKWGAAWEVSALLTADSTVKFDMIAYITDRNRHTGAYGYHEVERGMPVAYISPSALLHKVYGYYAPPRYSLAIKSKGVVITPAKLRTPARYEEGIVTVLVHECLEMLADAHVDKVSAPDACNEEWLLEPCDHVSGDYIIEQVGPIIAVLPNATLPSYYQLNGVAPFDLNNLSKTPFDTNSPSFYGYAIDPVTKKQTAIVKGSVHHK